MKSSAELRRAFLNYFQEKGHEAVASSPLVPGNDPTLLFTNAGMVQFKETFLGQEKRPYVRATSSQRCVRAGGKHNDLENVGYTARHHTFFEMLGNFSFGDYFKRDAIHYAWEFLTTTLGLPAEKLWVTVYQDDDEAADIWLKEIGVDDKRFTRIGDKPGGKRFESDNFWSMGDTGPCGPCSEIFYDHGADVAGGPPGTPEEDGDRYIEIWNLVFMQYNRDESGTMHDLPKPSVDTGMGLERLAAVMQGVHNNYEIDLFEHLVKSVAAIAKLEDLTNASARVIADHIRSCAFLVVDGVLPSNEGRGYVLRRIIRRAIRHGHKLGVKEAFFHQLVGPLCEEMGEAYPELARARGQVERVLKVEEERFAETLDQGMKILEEKIAALPAGGTIPGDVLFTLYDTYGFPVDLTADVARERDLKVDQAGFESEMEGQRERARAASQFAGGLDGKLDVEGSTEFSGYETLHDEGSVTALFRGGVAVDRLEAGEEGVVVLDRTPFYGESGGQVGDHGLLEGAEPGVAAEFAVTDTKKQSGVHLHIGTLSGGALSVGDKVRSEVNGVSRQSIRLNHSATHLLHAALRKVLGEHVAQKGSLCDGERLRFDFSHFEAVTAEQLETVERMVNAQVRLNNEVETGVMSYDEAVEAGAMALFGEKYGDKVRVLKMGDFSVELCGGTHAARTGDIGLFKITAEGGVASGVRRIEAVTGEGALAQVESAEQALDRIADSVKGDRSNVEEKVRQLSERTRALEKELDALKSKLAAGQGDELADQAVEVNGVKVLAARLDGQDVKGLRETLDKVKDKLGAAAVVLASVDDGKVRLVAGVTKAETALVKAGDLVNSVATQVGGKGGGRPDMAQAGGSDPSKLDEALAAVPDWVRGRLS